MTPAEQFPVGAKVRLSGVPSGRRGRSSESSGASHELRFAAD